MSYTDSLRGYSHLVHRRDGFRCTYCGLDGSKWPSWLFLSQDHLLPVGHPLRDDERFIVTACRICNEFHKRTLFDVGGRSPEEIIALKRTAIGSRRAEYEEFWRRNVEVGAANSLYGRRAIEGLTWVETLMAAEPVPMDAQARGHLPEVPGISAFSLIGQPTAVTRAGRATGVGGLRQRIYQNHLMGNQSGNFRAQLLRSGRCGSLEEAKQWIRSNCVVRYAVVEDVQDLWWIEHFMLSVLRPEFSD